MGLEEKRVTQFHLDCREYILLNELQNYSCFMFRLLNGKTGTVGCSR